MGLFVMGLFGAVIGLASYFENSLVFPGMKASEGWAMPSDPSTQDVWLTSADGTKIHAWYLPCEGATGAILFSHGNGGNLSHRDESIHQLRASFQRSILIYDYPGYGKSEGRPNEASVVAAGDAALAWLTQKHPAEQVILFGESLGGAVAVDIATRHDCQGLVLFSTFASLPKAAKELYMIIPCETLMSNRFDSISKMVTIRKPVFLCHGDADELISLKQAQRLFDAAQEPKRFRIRPGGTHNMPFDPAICEEARKFLDATRSTP
jgi:uncharacterized protein